MFPPANNVGSCCWQKNDLALSTNYFFSNLMIPGKCLFAFAHFLTILTFVRLVFQMSGNVQYQLVCSKNIFWAWQYLLNEKKTQNIDCGFCSVYV